jgi:anaerobic magnesium-protoporphyrin IX monomethyl ester cyclase
VVSATRGRPDIALVRGPEDRGAMASMPLPPLGLLYVASALEAAGVRVAVVDAPGEGLDQAGFLERVRMVGAPVIGLSGMTPMRDRIARDVALVRPLTQKIVLGGVHATRFREAVLDEFPGVDALVIGEGEGPAVALMDWWAQANRGDPPPGVLVRGQPFTEATAPPDLDQLAWPARHLVPHARYRYLFQTRPRFTTMISSRGCPFRCTFCDKTVSGSGWRARSAGDVVDELEWCQRTLGIGSVCIFDDNFTLRRKRVVAICNEILRRGLTIHWKCEARVDGVTPDLAKLMAAAGCRTVAFGVESGNQSSLETLKKDQQVEQAAIALAACKSAGIETVAYVLVGIPGEGPEESLETLRFAKQNGVDFIQFSTLSPFPGTELYEQAQREGWFRETKVLNPADAEERRATLVPPGWTEEELGRTLRRMYGGFYLRPGYLAKQALRAQRTGTLPMRARLGFEMARWYLGRPAA